MTHTKEVNPNLALHSWRNSHQAAEYIGISEYTLRRSRTTGKLLGKKSPAYRKMGRKIVYDLETLRTWINQFETQTNTAQNVA